MSHRYGGRGRSLRVGQEVRSYGFYRCPQCGKVWESAMTYSKYLGDGKYQACSEQACKQCNVMTLPYQVESLKKPDWGEERHDDDMSAGHRADLCQRCKSGRKCTRF